MFLEKLASHLLVTEFHLRLRKRRVRKHNLLNVHACVLFLGSVQPTNMQNPCKNDFLPRFLLQKIKYSYVIIPIIRFGTKNIEKWIAGSFVFHEKIQRFFFKSNISPICYDTEFSPREFDSTFSSYSIAPYMMFRS